MHYTNKHTYRNRPLTDVVKEANRKISSARSKSKHPFLMNPPLFSFTKARSYGLAKNANRVFSMLALFNLIEWIMALMKPVQ